MNLTTIRAYCQLMRLHKPTGFLLLALPGLMTLAQLQSLNSQVTVIVLLGAFLTRSLGCILNDLADRDIDKHVKRTAERPLSAGTLNIRQALGLAVILALASLYLATFIPRESFHWIFICALFITLYPLAKRVFIFPQIVLGLTFAQSVIITTFLTKEPLSSPILILFSAICLWVIAFDTVYAMADYEDDKKLEIFTLVKTLGISYSKHLAHTLHLSAQFLIFTLTFYKDWSVFTWISMFLSLSLMFLIFKRTYELKDLSKATPIFNLHVLQGLAWVLLLSS